MQGIMFILVFSVLPIAVVVGTVSAVIAARRADEAGGDAEGIGSVRRLFIYALALIGVIFAAVGVSMIIGGALDAAIGDTLLLDRRQGLAVALAFTVVGTPAWLLFMMLAQRSVQTHPVERRAAIRRLYFVLARSIALSVATWNGVSALEMLAGLREFSGGAWGYAVAWLGVWLIHQRMASAEPAFTEIIRLVERLGLYFGALLGLLMLLSGLIGVIDAPLAEAYDRLLRGTLLSAAWDRDLRAAAIILVVGLLIWAWHWLLQLRRGDRQTTMWRAYVFLFGALLGVTLAIVPAAVILYLGLEWLLGTPGSDTAVAHFSSVPGAFATLVAGLGSWAYHRAVLVEAGDAHARSAPERAYRYLLSAAGLVTAAIGVALVIALAAEGLSGFHADLVEPRSWWRNRLLQGVTFLAVGLPLWARYWRDTQGAIANGDEERGTVARRAYVFGTVGVAIFALLVSLTVVLYQVFQAVLAAEVSLLLLRDMDWGLGVAVTSGAIAYYHFLVLREDQAAMPPEIERRARTRYVVLVAPADAGDLAAGLARVEGVQVRSWRRTDAAAGGLSGERRDALRDAIVAADADRLLAIVEGGDFRLVPYEDESR